VLGAFEEGELMTDEIWEELFDEICPTRCAVALLALRFITDAGVAFDSNAATAMPIAQRVAGVLAFRRS
jgi:hypothetical protein